MADADLELPAELLQRSTFVCDSRSLALSSGMVGGAGPDESSIQAELGEQALCKTCREFPRLTHDYGGFV